MVRGQCNCGEVSFEINTEIMDVYVCHCSICRKATGSNGIPVVLVGKDKFRWLSGEGKITTWVRPEGHWQNWFCSVCGSPLPGINDDIHMYVPAGVIVEGAENLKVRHRIWVGSKASWDEIQDDGKQHIEGFEG